MGRKGRRGGEGKKSGKEIIEIRGRVYLPQCDMRTVQRCIIIFHILSNVSLLENENTYTHNSIPDNSYLMF